MKPVFVIIEGRESKLAEAQAIAEWVEGRLDITSHVCSISMTYQEAQMFNAKYLGDRLTCMHPSWDHVITGQTDGFPYNPDAWEDAFLDWDYIGPPWPPRLVAGAAGMTVGSSGCCMRSRKFFRLCQRITFTLGVNDDVWMCQLNRERLEGMGAKFAPPDVASRFAVEEGTDVPWPALGNSFAFHGLVPERREYLRGLGATFLQG